MQVSGGSVEAKGDTRGEVDKQPLPLDKGKGILRNVRLLKGLRLFKSNQGITRGWRGCA